MSTPKDLIAKSFNLLFRYFHQLSEFESAFCKLNILKDGEDESLCESNANLDFNNVPIMIYKIQQDTTTKMNFRMFQEDSIIAKYIYQIGIESPTEYSQIIEKTLAYMSFLIENDEKHLSLQLSNVIKVMLYSGTDECGSSRNLTDLQYFYGNVLKVVQQNHKLVDIQQTLLNNNISDLVISMVMKSQEIQIFLIEALNMTHAILKNGNTAAQGRFFNTILAMESPTDFFKLIYDKFQVGFLRYINLLLNINYFNSTAMQA